MRRESEALEAPIATVGMSGWWTMLGRVLRETAGPVMLIWLVAMIIELAMGQMLRGPQPGTDIFGAAARLNLLSFLCFFFTAFVARMLRTGLYRPMRRQMLEGENPPTFRGTLSDAAGQIPSAMAMTFLTQFLLASVAVVCIIWNVVVPAIVFLPVVFMTQLALYFLVARDLRLQEALWLALQVSRRHWLFLVGMQTGALLLSLGLLEIFEIGRSTHWFALFTPGHLDATALSSLAQRSIELIASYLHWLMSAACFLVLDRATD